jgi:hypothetical protein
VAAVSYMATRDSALTTVMVLFASLEHSLCVGS